MDMWNRFYAASVAMTLATSPACVAEPLYEQIHAFHAYIMGDVAGHVTLEHHALANVVPASALKAVTALLAYKVLGPDFTFTTTLSVTKSGGKVQDAILKGSGDPTLTSQDLEQLLTPLKGKTLPGTLYVDMSAYQLPEYSTNIMRYDLGCFDARPHTAFNLDGNLFNLHITQAGLCVKATDDLGQEHLSAITLHEGATNIATLWTLDGLKVLGKLNKTELTALHPVAPERLEPYLTQKIQAVLKKLQITATLRLTKDAKILPTGQELLGTHHSAPLKAFLPPALKISDNFVFEALYLRMIHDHASAPITDWHEGDSVIKALAKTHFQVDLGPALIVDGSGLSRHNQLSARAFYDLLCAGANIPEFVASLAKPGEALSSLATRTDLPPHIRAKTGYMLGIVALCGYSVDDQEHPTQAFMVVANHVPGSPAEMRKVHDAFVKEHLGR